MQIIISIMIIGLLWMIYDLINAPEVDENENVVDPTTDLNQDADNDLSPDAEKDKRKVSEVDK